MKDIKKTKQQQKLDFKIPTLNLFGIYAIAFKALC